LVFSAKGLEMPLGWDGSAAEAGKGNRVGFDQDTTAYAVSGPLGDATPQGTSYRLFDNWGGVWSDAEKTVANTEDDLMCWAAAASNVLAWTGWGNTESTTNADQVFAYFQNHWTDEGGLMEFGWDWWFDGSNSSQGWDGWSQVDVAGGGFYPDETFASYFHSQSDTQLALSSIDSYLHSGYGVTLGIYGPGGHAITCWGVNYATDTPSNYLGLWITDSDDDKGSNTPPDCLHYYEVANVDGKWFLQDYYGSDAWYIGAVQALAPKTIVPQGNVIRGTVANDQNGDGQRQETESGLAGEVVYLDANANGQFDHSSTLFASNTPRAVPDNGTCQSTITVSGVQAISDLNVSLDLTHTYDGDLVVSLISPTGTRVQLFGHVGGSGQNFTSTTFDDEASTDIAAGAAPFTGTFRSTELLSRFDGENPNGVWTLEVSDTMAYDSGTLNRWSLQIESGERAATTGADGGYLFTGLTEGNYTVGHVVRSGWTDTYPNAGQHTVQLAGQVAEDIDFLTTQAAALPSATDLGQVDYTRLNDLDPSLGDLWYRLQTAHAGYLTLEALFTGSTAGLELYDANLGLLASSAASEGGQRIDWNVNAGEQYFVKLSGSLSDVDLQLANLVRLSQGAVTVVGTTGVDRFDFAAAAWHQLTVNGVHYEFNSTSVTSLSIDGLGGNDTAVMCTSTGNDTAVFRPTTLALSGPGYIAAVRGVANLIAINTGGTDVAHLYDSTGNDTFEGRPDYAQMTGQGFFNRVEGFGYVHGYALSGGTDAASLYDSVGNDTFIGRPDYSTLSGASYFLRAKRFDTVQAYSTTGGLDAATFFDSSGADVYTGTQGYGQMSGAGYGNQANGFDWCNAYSTAGGIDSARLYDSAGDETLIASPIEATLTAAGYGHRVVRFESMVAYASGGCDVAHLYDSRGNDTFTASPTIASLTGAGYCNRARSFDFVHAYATAGGYDVAHLYGSAGDDTFVGRSTWSKMSGANYFFRAKFFDAVYGHAVAGGTDRAYLYDDTGNDYLQAAGAQAALTYANGARAQAEAFSWVQAAGTSGGRNTKHVETTDFALECVGIWTPV
jgi:subtilisin-like proprotein convertase family protein